MGNRVSLSATAQHHVSPKTGTHFVVGEVKIRGIQRNGNNVWPESTSGLAVWVVGSEKTSVVYRRPGSNQNRSEKESRPFWNTKHVIPDIPEWISEGQYYKVPFYVKLPDHLPRSGRTRGSQRQGISLRYHVLVEFEDDKNVHTEVTWDLTEAPPTEDYDRTELSGTVPMGNYQVHYRVPSLVQQGETIQVHLGTTVPLSILAAPKATLALYEVYNFSAHGHRVRDQELLYQADDVSVDQDISILIAKSALDSFQGKIANIRHEIRIQYQREWLKQTIPITIHAKKT